MFDKGEYSWFFVGCKILVLEYWRLYFMVFWERNFKSKSDWVIKIEILILVLFY